MKIAQILNPMCFNKIVPGNDKHSLTWKATKKTSKQSEHPDPTQNELDKGS